MAKSFQCPECHNIIVEAGGGGVFRKSNQQQIIQERGDKFFLRCLGKKSDKSNCNYKLRVIPKENDEYIIAHCVYSSVNQYANDSWECVYPNKGLRPCPVIARSPCDVVNGPFQDKEQSRYGTH